MCAGAADSVLRCMLRRPIAGQDVLVASDRQAPGALVTYASVMVGGMLGGAARYAVSLAWPTEPGRIPWGILSVNVLGALVLSSILSRWVVRHGHAGHPWRPFLATGILGAFTTWSTFASDVRLLWVGGDVLLSVIYLVGGTVAGIVAAGLGWGWAVRRYGDPEEVVVA